MRIRTEKFLFYILSKVSKKLFENFTQNDFHLTFWKQTSVVAFYSKCSVGKAQDFIS